MIHLEDQQYIRQQVALPPNNAVDRLSRRSVDGTHGVRFRRRLGVAVVTFGFPLLQLVKGSSGKQSYSTLMV